MKKILALALAILTVVSFSACSLINSFTEKTISEKSPTDTTGEHLSKLYEGKIIIDGVEYDYSTTTVADLLKDGWAIAPLDKGDPNIFYGEINLVKGDKSFFVQNSYADVAEEGDNALPIFSFTERIENYADDYKPVFKLPGDITLMDDYKEISAAYGKPAEYSGSPTSANISYGLNDGTYIYFRSSEFLDEATNFTNTYRELNIQAATAYPDYPVATDLQDVLPEDIGDETMVANTSPVNLTETEESAPNVNDDAPVNLNATEESAPNVNDKSPEGVGGLDMTSPNIEAAPSNVDDFPDSSHPMIINDNPVEGA